MLRDQNLANQLRDARDAAAIHAVLAKETPPAA
jgi:hypothetical protein